jgi:hypothetical protein
MPELTPAVRYVAENQLLFEANKSNYGDFSELHCQIERLRPTIR